MSEDAKGLKETTIKSVGIVYGMVAFTKLLNLLALVVLARILFPEDFGLVTISAVIIGIITLFKDFGLSAAFIQRRTDDDEAADIVFWSNIALRLILYAVAFLVAPFVADFFGEPLVDPVMKVASLSFVIEAFSSAHSAKLTKNLEFRKITMVAVSTSIVVTISTVAFALLGFSFWSLVLGGLVGEPVGVILYWRVCKWRPKARFDRRVAKDMFTYGRDVVGINFLGFGVRNLDNFVVGKVMGSVALGTYTLGRRFGLYSATNIVSILGRVLFPAYAKLQAQKERIRRAYMKTFYPVSMLAFPAAIGLIVLSREFVGFVLGPNWTEVEAPLRILSVYGLFYSLSAIGSNIFLALKRQDVPLKILAVEVAFMLAFIYPATHYYGLLGTAAFVTLTIAAGSAASVVLVTRLLSVGAKDMGRMIGIPFASSIVMAVILVAVKLFLPFSLLTFVIELAIGSAVYIGVLYLLSGGELGDQVREILATIKPQKNGP